MSSIFNGINEAARSPEPDYDDPSWDEKVSNVGQKAKQAEVLKSKGKEPKTRWNPETKKYYVDFSDVDESAGLPSPSTYEQTNDMFKSSGQRRIGTLTTENDDPFRGTGGRFNRGDDERHDLDPSDWYIVKDGKLFAASIYPRQVQQAIAQGFSRTKAEARARASSQGVTEAEKNPHTSALGRALYRDLSKEKKASPQQVQRNKERWAQRQADKEQGVAEGMNDDQGTNVDEILYHLTSGYRSLQKHSDFYQDFSIITHVYETLRSYLKEGDIEGFHSSYERMLSRYPDAAVELFDAMFESAGLPPEEGTIEQFLDKCSQQGVAEGSGFDKWADDRSASQLHKLKRDHSTGKKSSSAPVQQDGEGWEQRQIEKMKKYRSPEQGVAEAGDTAKGQKQLAKVHHRAADRVTSKQADKDPEYARKAQQTQDRAWDRLAVKEQGMAEGFDSAAFDRHMDKLRAQKELEKTDPMRAMVNKMKSDYDYNEKSKSKSKQDDERQITDPFHPSQGVNIGEQGVAEGEEQGIDNKYRCAAKEMINVYNTNADVKVKVDASTDPLEAMIYTTGVIRNPERLAGTTHFNKLMSELESIFYYGRQQGVAEQKCPHCGGVMVSEELMNEKKDACYYKVKSRYKVWPSAYASGALVKCRKSHGSWGNGSKNESSILEGIERADENLHQWFKEKWVRFGPDGKIRGDCARGDDSEGKPKCLPQSKAQNLGKKGRASAASRKRREDPNPERSGPAINVNTKKK